MGYRVRTGERVRTPASPAAMRSTQGAMFSQRARGTRSRYSSAVRIKEKPCALPKVVAALAWRIPAEEGALGPLRVGKGLPEAQISREIGGGTSSSHGPASPLLPRSLSPPAAASALPTICCLSRSRKPRLQACLLAYRARRHALDYSACCSPLPRFVRQLNPMHPHVLLRTGNRESAAAQECCPDDHPDLSHQVLPAPCTLRSVPFPASS